MAVLPGRAYSGLGGRAGELASSIRMCLYKRVLMDVLAEPMRRELLRSVWEEERSVGSLVEEFGVTQPAISHHLRRLREAGLVEVRRDAQRRLYRAVPEALGELRGYMEAYWAEGLGRLADEAELKARRQARS